MGCAHAAEGAKGVDIDAFLKEDQVERVRISPTGEYLAATMELDDATALIIRRRSDWKVTASVEFGKDQHINRVDWVNPGRLVMSMAYRQGRLEQPIPTGELYAIDADGGKVENLIGQRVAARGGDTRIQYKKVERVAALMIDPLAADDRFILVQTFDFSDDPLPSIEKLNVYTGQRAMLGKSPVRNADFITDAQGVVRFAQGYGEDLVNKLFYRDNQDAPWKLINDEAVSGHAEHALGLSADGRIAYLQVEHDKGPDAIVAFDVATGERKEILRDAVSDPVEIFYRNGGVEPIGAKFMNGKPRLAFFDDSLPESRLYKSLGAAFAGNIPEISSSTADGKLALVRASSDRNPGDYYVFDREAKKADLLMSSRTWLAPDSLAPMQPISLTARDGLQLSGYLTVPVGSSGKGLPMVVLPHGGPFGARDYWEFNQETQLLAAAGYAVLQVNFRGSSGYGHAFSQAGARQWGGAMQDDLTDATRWATQQGVADPRRICIYGASYGGYAALMGVAKEPDLYRCAVGYVGIYDLPLRYTKGLTQEWGSGKTFLKDWIGEEDAIAAVSPNRIADRIKVPVFLAAGGEDERAPLQHSKLMEAALNKAGVPVETLYYPTEGHGFYTPEHQREYYTRLLAFLSRHLGGETATAGAGGK
ncbi:S9 family peptidase [Lysobacter fragariae]